MIWTTEGLVSGWYWLAIIAFMAVGIYGTYEHKTIMPFLWAGAVSLILWGYASVLSTFIFGFQYHDAYSIEWVVTTVFGLLFAALNITYGYNVITKGTVVE